ncbi:DUF4239 domain-containing protein [Methylobacterium sp. sgz302541]|uniref:bestrophin-like domain n=1 Tax=unclassified Methylobacterium TaxID=2615210 RepID=UPI003D344478
MLLGLWLDLPVWLIFATLAALFLGLVGLICLVSNLRPTRQALLGVSAGVVAPYFSSISVLLALLTGFVANDAWERQRSAARTVQTERANIVAVHDLSIATVSDMADIRGALIAYVDALIEDEWPRMMDGDSSPRAGLALSTLMRLVADPSHETASGAAAHAALLNAVVALRNARGERLALSDTQSDQSKWLNLLVLAGLTLVGLALVHMEKPRAQATTMLIFSLAVVVTLGVIALHERPFDGPMAISSAPLKAAKTSMAARSP